MAYPDKIGPTSPIVPAHPAGESTSRRRVIRQKKDEEPHRDNDQSRDQGKGQDQKQPEGHNVDEYV